MPANAGDLTGRTLLAVFAHPDDESIACGGLLALCAERGARVTLVCATHGEDAASKTHDRAALFDVRARELQAAADRLGLAEVVLLDYPDGELKWLEDDRAGALRAAIQDAITRIRPEAVVTFGDDGLYWHPDHIAIHELTTEAVASLGADAPALYYVTMPPGAVRRLVDAVTAASGDERAGLHVLGIEDPDAFGALAQAPSIELDVSQVAARKLQALKSHQTQVAGGALERLVAADAARLLGVEHFHRAAVGAVTPTFVDQL
jgi:LmbE family N-acetylglucosaminyl deacetylase